MRALLLLLTASTLCACPSVSLLGTARTVDKGTTQWAAGMTSMGNIVTRPSMGTGQSFSVGAMWEVAVRHGFTDRFELGGRLAGTSLQADGKVALLRAESQRGFDLSLAPSVGLLIPPVENPSPHIPLQLAVLGGYGFDVAYITVGLRFMDELVFYQGAGHGFWSGVNVGVALKLSDRVSLVPEVAVMVPLRGTLDEVSFRTGMCVLFGP